MKKIILIILGALVIGAGLIILKEKDTERVSKTDTNDLTFLNEKFYYKLEYPISATIKNYSETNTNILLTQDLFFNINVYLKDNDQNLSIQDWWQQNGPQNERQAPYPDEEKIIQVAGVDAYYTRYDTESSAFGYNQLSAVFIYVPHDGNIYEISGAELPPDPQTKGLTQDEINVVQEYTKTFNQMLTSFEFIDA